MPMIINVAKAPAGFQYLHVLASGTVTVEDALALNAKLAVGGPHATTPILGVVESGADFSAEARQALTNGGKREGEGNKTAIVVTSAPLRVMLTFVVRISGGAQTTRFFNAEAPALAWLEEVVKASAA
jgi:hypothetical protein